MVFANIVERQLVEKECKLDQWLAHALNVKLEYKNQTKMFSNTKKMALLYIIAIFFISLDRLAKTYFSNTRDVIPIINSYLSLNYAENLYIAFSIPITPNFIKYLSLSLGLFIAGSFIKFFKERRQIYAFPLFLLILGSFSNIFDRFRYGFVIDYIDLKYFAIFNIADSMIFTSIIILSYYIYTIDKKKEILYDK